MQNTIERYVYNVYGITLVLGLLLGTTSLYIKDKCLQTYNDAWGNPFYNFILFFLVGIWESLIPLLVFFLLTKLIVKYRLNRLLIYIAGLMCTVAPFVQLYFMVNEGYHRSNVIIYAICFMISLLTGYWLNRVRLSTFYLQVNDKELSS